MSVRVFSSLLLISLLLSLANEKSCRADATSTDNELPIPARLETFPFGPQEVQLLDGPFLKNQQAVEGELLALDPDRLLYNFRFTAHLPTPGQPYGGDEASTSPIRGTFFGHYLSALAQIYAATGDEKVHDRLSLLIRELVACQDALGSGYFGEFPEGAFVQVERFPARATSPYATLHVVMAGLLDAYQATGNVQALELDRKIARYLDARLQALFPAQIAKMLDKIPAAPGRNESGGMADVLLHLFYLTENPADYKLAQIFIRKKELDPFVAGQDPLTGQQATSFLKQVVGWASDYEANRDGKAFRASCFVWQDVVQNRSFVTGGTSVDLHFQPSGAEAKVLSPLTCGVGPLYNMLKLTRHLAQWHPDATYYDYYERGLYNEVLGEREPKQGALAVFLPLSSGACKMYADPQGFWPSLGVALENQTSVAGSIYTHDAENNALWVNLFVPSELKWKATGMTIRQETQFPESDTIRLIFTNPSQLAYPVYLRIPAWATQGVTVAINGKSLPVAPIPASYLKIDHFWKSGDVLTLILPRQLRIYHAPDDVSRVAILYGPLVLAGVLGTENLPPNDQIASDPTAVDSTPSVVIPKLVASDADLTQGILADPTRPLHFQTQGIAYPFDLPLVPIYQIHHERYVVYWKKFDTLRELKKSEDKPK